MFKGVFIGLLITAPLWVTMLHQMSPFMEFNLPPAPPHTRWEVPFMCVGVHLYSDGGRWIGAVSDQTHAYTYVCGNEDYYMHTSQEAIAKVAACGKEYIEQGNK